MSHPTTSRLATSVQTTVIDGGEYNPSLRTPGLNLRYGKVVGWDVTTQLADIQFSDDGLILEQCDHLSNYTPTVGDHVYVLVFGPDLIILDRIASEGEGPSLFAGASFGAGDGNLRLNSNYAAAGDFANIVFNIPPPFVFAGRFVDDPFYGKYNTGPVYVGPSGQIILAVSCFMQIGTDASNANMSGTGYCSPWITPRSRAYDVPPAVAFSCAFTGSTGQMAMVSNLTVVEGFDPGAHDIKLICASMGAYVYFGLQTIVAIPT